MSDRKPRLCVITTGGTIGMVRDADGIAHPPVDHSDFHNLLGPIAGRYDLTALPLMNRDSTNMLPSDWSRIAEHIDQSRGEGFDGYVVTHGTDTLAHSAAAVAFALGPPPLLSPVVFTGAMHTPDHDDYDGLANLQTACRVASANLGEVVIAFGSSIYRGVRVEKVSATELDAFASPESYALGRVAEEVVLHDDAVRRGNEAEHPHWPAETGFADRVATVSLTPGLEPALYESLLVSDRPCRGVLLRTLGAGNVSSRETTDWVRWIARATEQDIPVVLTSSFFGGRTDASGYALGQAAIEAGAIPHAGLTEPCVEVKLRHSIAAAQRHGVAACEFVRNVMAHNYFGELGGSPQSTTEDE
ncbi:asparaginase [Algisphaera agarilytica]|uniref:L-asparaginase/Glu-tRNA(Gln) amidotransferase subunit D n=1 Tax=Algisphaera agarilytica TaxID=1385975 RepID=A0A7X0LKK0_9BACT|nr:asparaginase domain-containing protein [Algisphaera agarilytica]MBB6429929.1 L-asparaginase/Glu-tRNA(Gln) amidotransferase subunit D [Algisphaera agarilytica]